MAAYNSGERLSLAEIVKMPWYNGPIDSPE